MIIIILGEISSLPAEEEVQGLHVHLRFDLTAQPRVFEQFQGECTDHGDYIDVHTVFYSQEYAISIILSYSSKVTIISPDELKQALMEKINEIQKLYTNANRRNYQMTILVTGATGTVGRHVVDQLVQKGEQVRAVSRNPEKANLPAGVEVVAGDLNKPDTLQAALDGVKGLFLIISSDEANATFKLSPK